MIKLLILLFLLTFSNFSFSEELECDKFSYIEGRFSDNIKYEGLIVGHKVIRSIFKDNNHSIPLKNKNLLKLSSYSHNYFLYTHKFLTSQNELIKDSYEIEDSNIIISLSINKQDNGLTVIGQPFWLAVISKKCSVLFNLDLTHLTDLDNSKSLSYKEKSN